MEMRKKLCSRKFCKPSDGDQENVDRLSSLPDDVLIHILSFLPTKIYVATSILGRRWRFLWARVPNLDFDEYDAGASRISSIVNRVMFLHKRQNIYSFRFYHCLSPAEFSDYEFEKWIITTIECNVQELDLSLDSEKRLPLCILTCKTLVKMSLSWLHMPTVGTVYLPALKKLLLDQVYFKTAECFGHLLSGCPVLNELFIESNSYMGEPGDEEGENSKICCCISSPTLIRLHLQEILWTGGFVIRVMLDTPKLKYLMIDNYVPYFSHEALSKDFSEVPHFAIFASTTTFHNITELESVADWCFISSLLEKANNLELLTICRRDGDSYPTNWVDPEQVPACLVSHLGAVRISDFRCADQEFEAVRYILRNAKVLKRMEIYTKRHEINLKKQHEALKRISLFERGSEACQLAFD